MTKILAIWGGMDWAGASVEYYVKITERDTKDLRDEYNNLGGYHGTQMWFGQWLVLQGYCREADEAELELFED